MSNAEETLVEIEVDMKQAKEAIELMDALEKLHNDPNWKLVIEDHYFKTYASNIVLNKAHPNQDDPNAQAYINKQIDAIGMFRQYLNAIRQLGLQQKQALARAQEAQTEILETDEEEELAAEEAIA